jgi:hypothetical protein
MLAKLTKYSQLQTFVESLVCKRLKSIKLAKMNLCELCRQQIPVAARRQSEKPYIISREMRE